MELRKEKFYQSLVPYVAKYGKDMVRAFYDYWTEKTYGGRKIQKRFKLIEHTSVNGETECTVHDADWELFKETSKRGFFKIRHKTE